MQFHIRKYHSIIIKSSCKEFPCENQYNEDMFNIFNSCQSNDSISENLKEGYIAMSKINQKLCEFGLQADLEDLSQYESRL